MSLYLAHFLKWFRVHVFIPWYPILFAITASLYRDKVFQEIVLRYILKIKYAYENGNASCTSPAAPEAALSLRDKFVRDYPPLSSLPRHSRRTKGPSELGETLVHPSQSLRTLRISSLLRRLSSNFQRFDGRLIWKIYEPFASSRSRVKDAVRSNGA